MSENQENEVNWGLMGESEGSMTLSTKEFIVLSYIIQDWEEAYGSGLTPPLPGGEEGEFADTIFSLIEKVDKAGEDVVVPYLEPAVLEDVNKYIEEVMGDFVPGL